MDLASRTALRLRLSAFGIAWRVKSVKERGMTGSEYSGLGRRLQWMGWRLVNWDFMVFSSRSSCRVFWE